MYKVNHLVYWLLQLSWGLIQNVVGFGIFLVLHILDFKREKHFYHGAIVTMWKYPFSMGCGMWIFLGHKGKNVEKVLVHEYGHTIQSIILGPLFMPVVAIPSLTWAFTPVFVKYRRKTGYLYTDFYCEAWANNLGKLIIKKEPIRN